MEITAEVRFKIWVDRAMIDSSGGETIPEVAAEFLSLHVNDHPTMQADIETTLHTQVLDVGGYIEEPVICPVCEALFFLAHDADYIDRHGHCDMCPDPAQER